MFQGVLYNSVRHFHRTAIFSKEYYKILAVSSNASQAEVKKAYYNLAKKYHPDRNPGDPKAEALFQKVAEAYEVLGDDVKRKEYDRNLTSTSQAKSSPFQQGSGRKPKTAKSAWNYDLESDPLELFRKVFGDLSASYEAAAEDQTSFVDNGKCGMKTIMRNCYKTLMNFSDTPRAFVTISLREAAVGVSRCVTFLKPQDSEK